jgi:hypothetical protein
MKKLISLLAASMLLTCSFAGCEDADSDSDSESAAKTSVSESDEDDTTTDTESETETETTKKTTKAVTTKEATTEATTKAKSTKSSSVDVPGEIGGDIIGTWKMDEDTVASILNDDSMKGMKITEANMEFSKDNKFSMHLTMDVSSLMSLKDEEPLSLYGEDITEALKGKAFSLGGISCPIYDFDGKSFRTGISSTYYTFTRSSKSDDIYGEYDLPDDFGDASEFDTATLTFEKSGVCYMSFSTSEEYEYNKKTGEVTLGEDDDEPSTVSFIDDDTMVISDADEVKGTLKRVK